MKIRELLLPRGCKRRRGNKLKSIRGVTIHNTGNNSKGADADANARYQLNACNEAVNGWHWTVDESEAILSIPEDEIAEHAGKREGNDTTVGVEICDNCDGDILRATNNAAELAAAILKRQGYKKAVWKENIWQHNDWSGKDCPEQIRKGRPYNWQAFVERVNRCMSGVVSENAKPVEVPKVTEIPPFNRILYNTQPYHKGADVKALQERLIALGYNLGKCGADGCFGAATEKAVHDFKVKHCDGVVDALTWDKLFSEA